MRAKPASSSHGLLLTVNMVSASARALGSAAASLSGATLA